MARLISLLHLNVRVLVACLLMFFALYVGLGRIALSFLPQYHADIERLISDATGKTVSISQLEGSWYRFDPEVIVHGFVLSDEAGNEQASVSNITVRLAFLDSFIARDLRFKAIVVEGASFSAVQISKGTKTEPGVWKIASYTFRNMDSEASEGNLFSRWIDGAEIRLFDTQIRVDTLRSEPRDWTFPSITLAYDDNAAHGSGQLLHQDGNQPILNFSLHAERLFSDKPPIGHLYVEARSLSFLDNILASHQFGEYAFTSLDASGRFWMDFNGGGQFNAEGELQIRELNLSKGDQPLPSLNKLATNFSFEKNIEGKVFTLRDLGWSWHEIKCQPLSAVYEQDDNSGTQSVYINVLDLDCLNHMALDLSVVEGKLKKRLEVSRPEGYLRDVFIDLPQEGEFDLTAKLDKVGLNDFFGTPSGAGINGFIRADAVGGDVWLKSDNFVLGFPDLFKEAFVTDKAQALVSWRIEDEDTLIFSDGIRLILPDKSWVYGDFNLRLNGDEDEDYLGLALAMQDIPFPEVADFVPYYRVDKDLHNWLSHSLKSGTVTSGIYYGYGSIENNSAINSFSSSLRVQTEEGALKFQPDWPQLTELDASIELQNEALWVDAPSAQIAGSVLTDVAVRLPEFKKDVTRSIEVNAGSTLNEDNIRYWLMESPIAAHTTGVANAIDISGDLNLGLALGIPLNDEDVAYDLSFSLEDNIVTHTDSKLKFESINGNLRLNSDTGLSADDIDLVFQGEPTQLIASTMLVGGDVEGDNETASSIGDTKLNFTGKVSLDSLFAHFEQDVFPGLSGEFLHDSTLTIPVDGSHAKLDVLTNMLGVKRDWPAPLAKAPESEEYASLTLHFLEESLDLELGMRLGVADTVSEGMTSFALKTELSIPNEGRTNGLIRIAPREYRWLEKPAVEIEAAGTGKAETTQTSELSPSDTEDTVVQAAQAAPPQEFGEATVIDDQQASLELGKTPSDNGGVLLEARSLSIELEPWINYIEEVQNYFPESSGESSWFQSLDLKFERLRAFGQSFDDSEALITSEEEGWKVVAKGESIAGDILLASDDRLLTLDLTHLAIVTDDTNHEANAVKTDLVSASVDQIDPVFDPKTLPELNFSVDSLLLDYVNYGSWNTEIRHSDKGIRFENVSGQVSGLTFKGLMNWDVVDDHPNTFLELSVAGKNIEPFFKRIGKSAPISSDTISADFSLVWPDEPQNFSLDRISGRASIIASEGFLKTSDSKTGALRLMGIFSADALVRRLRLDFSDIYKSGIGYDSLELFARIDQGYLTLDPSLVIAGPSSKYEITGGSDLGEQTLDLKMKVELPIGSNVPFAAVLLGAPQIGGAVWLLDKVLGEPLSSIASADYKVKGTWDEPKLSTK